MATYEMEKEGVYCSMVVGAQNNQIDTAKALRDTQLIFGTEGNQTLQRYQMKFEGGSIVDLFIADLFHDDYQMNAAISIAVVTEKLEAQVKARKVHYTINSIPIDKETADGLKICQMLRSTLEERVDQYITGIESGKIQIKPPGEAN